jgi:hypothetical protein
LKYYHPEVGKGKFEWDKEFLKYLPQVLKAKEESLSTIYINWIDSLGTIKVCRKCIQRKIISIKILIYHGFKTQPF